MIGNTADVSQEIITMNQTANPEEETVYVLFSREIDEHATESLIDLMIRCSNEGVTHVCLLISTPGGSVSDGIRLHNVLRAFPEVSGGQSETSMLNSFVMHLEL